VALPRPFFADFFALCGIEDFPGTHASFVK
jgi:hypothetical protein